MPTPIFIQPLTRGVNSNEYGTEREKAPITNDRHTLLSCHVVIVTQLQTHTPATETFQFSGNANTHTTAKVKTTWHNVTKT